MMISRAVDTMAFPLRFMLVVAMNPNHPNTKHVKSKLNALAKEPEKK